MQLLEWMEANTLTVDDSLRIETEAAKTDSRALEQQLDATKQELEQLASESHRKDASHERALQATEQRGRAELARVRAEADANANAKAEAERELSKLKEKHLQLEKRMAAASGFGGGEEELAHEEEQEEEE